MLAKRISLLLVVLILAFTNGSVVSFADVNKKNVAIILAQGSSMHEETVSEILAEIEEEAINVSFKYVYNDDEAEIQLLKSEEIDLVISVGTTSARTTLASNPNYPVLYTLIPKQTLDGLLALYKIDKSEIGAIYLTQPIERKLQIAKIILGRPGRVGITLHSRESIFRKELRIHAKDNGLDVVIKYASDYNKPVSAMNDALVDSDIYLALYDSKVLNKHTAKWLLYMAYKKGKPVIGLSNGYTKAGAVASIFSTPQQIGKQTAEWLISSLNNEYVEKVQSPKYFTVTINKRIQRILGLENISAEDVAAALQEMENISNE